jgi:hypothetical protein
MSMHDDDYEVGYGKPPVATQFKKGRSGNPCGRPKGAKGFNASIKREMDKMITVREGNRVIKISKAEAAAKRFFEKALKGEMVALKMLASFDSEQMVQDEELAVQKARDTEPDQTDHAILNHFAAQITKMATEPACEGEMNDQI